MQYVSINLKLKSRSGTHLLFPSCHFVFGLGVDGNEIERLRSKKKKLEESVDELEESLKSMQTEQRLIEDEAAKLQKERV